MGIVRALIGLIVMGLVAPAVARAATAICDDDSELVSVPATLLRSPAVPAESLVAGPPAVGPSHVVVGDDDGSRGEQCRPGMGAADGCHPYQPLPAPSRSAGPLSFESFVVLPPPALPPPAASLAAPAPDAEARLAPGFTRRVDRPPRAC